ncbi:hypothetical protein KVR01_002008 [Diaporthe batatas]|uniref:uncharacterized protein n=1 Tax=Diaporthe batatas TaxID=748121 RepID=UPI001D0401B3|nr:uncharacterized protein KVR01_002008 [Diaporthe batatas]KAG8166319.1 hypothetical protein KVR01_002008 [Diaporthe batatas]
MFTSTGLRALLRPARTSIRPTPSSQDGITSLARATAALSISPPTTTASPSTPRAFSTTAAPLARAPPKQQRNVKGGTGKGKGQPMDAAARKKRRAQMAAKLDPKVADMMKFIYAGSQLPPPLRMARNRWLRHWTIHRAWQLFRRKEAEAREREMMRMQQSMAHACEALRNMGGPGPRPEGWLYRKAMQKFGVWGKGAIPIEYARPMVETPAEKAWNHEWKRQ